MPPGASSYLVLVCRVSTFYRLTKRLEETLRQVLNQAVGYFDFGHAQLVLLRGERKPVLLEAGRAGHWEEKAGELAGHYTGPAWPKRPLNSFYPTTATTLPVILRAGEPLGTMEMGVFHPDPQAAKNLLNKAVPLARHIADIVQESLFRRQKEPDLRRLAVWLETVNAISSTLDLKQVLHLVTQLAADLLRARCSILLLEEGTNNLLPAVAVGTYDPVLKKKFKALRGRPPFTAVERVIKTREPLVLTPDNLAELVPPDFQADFELQWTVMAPIPRRDRVIGLLQVDRPPNPAAFTEATAFTREEVEIIAAMAKEAGIAYENAALVETLEQKEQLLHRLVDKIITVQEDERKRVASDIHDGVIQALLGIWYRLQRLTSQGGGGSAACPACHQDLAALRDDLGAQIQEIRRIVHNLRPLVLDNYGLLAAIETSVEALRQEHGLAVEMRVEGREERLPVNVEITLYRVFQEALANVLKHARASRVEVRLAFAPDRVRLVVRDDGQGFTARPQVRPETHLGLAGIQERVWLLGGRCEIDSFPGRGTSVVVTIPLEQDTPAPTLTTGGEG